MRYILLLRNNGSENTTFIGTRTALPRHTRSNATPHLTPTLRRAGPTHTFKETHTSHRRKDAHTRPTPPPPHQTHRHHTASNAPPQPLHRTNAPPAGTTHSQPSRPASRRAQHRQPASPLPGPVIAVIGMGGPTPPTTPATQPPPARQTRTLSPHKTKLQHPRPHSSAVEHQPSFPIYVGEGSRVFPPRKFERRNLVHSAVCGLVGSTGFPARDQSLGWCERLHVVSERVRSEWLVFDGIRCESIPLVRKLDSVSQRPRSLDEQWVGIRKSDRIGGCVRKAGSLPYLI